MCQCQAVSMIFAGRHPRMFRAFEELPIKTGGSPARRFVSTHSMAVPVICSAIRMTLRTEKPFPLPRLKESLDPQPRRYSRTRIWASARSVTWM